MNRINQNNKNIILILRKLFSFFSPKRKAQFIILVILMLLSGFAEMISFTAVIPFLTVLTEPNKLLAIDQINNFYKILNFNNPSELLTPISIGFILISIISALIKLSTIWLNGRFAASIGSEISIKSFTNALMQPYSVHTERKTSEVISTNTSYLNATVLVLHQTLWFISNLIISSLIFLGLLIVDYSVAIKLFLIFGFSYIFLMFNVKSTLVRNSEFISKANQKQIKTIQEGLGSIRDIILNNTYRTFIDIYKNIDINMRIKNANSIFLSIYPRNILEILGIIFLVSIALILNNNNQSSIKDTLPLLGAFALGAQRLLPAMQQSYNSWATINAYSSELLNVINSLNQKVDTTLERDSDFRKSIKKFINKISFQSISYKYNPKGPLILKNFNLDIYKGEKIGIMGTTGCGKSTLIDLLMGLLIPTKGKILVDGEDINNKKYLEEWRRNISHVPQNIFITDNSFAENIAFGLKKEQIDISRVKKAAKLANISSFIESTYHSYETPVGEGGIKLSGGQRQRLGIARALYKKTELIIFDEATSALDKYTEEKVIQSIKNLNKDITIIIIAHRLSTLSFCDKIIDLKNNN